MRKGGVIALAVAAILLAAAARAPTSWTWPAGRAAPTVPRDNAMSPAKVELGRRLFYDADLSIDGTMACSSCHVQRHAFADSTATRPGVHGDPGRRNAPGLANAAWARRLTWGDPRVRTLEAQVAIPLFGTDPVEMGMRDQEAEIVRRLGRDACYVRMFRAAFPQDAGRIDTTTVARALAAFQRSIISDRAPYDRWRRGDKTALSTSQSQGEALFRRACVTCHAGPDLTDGRFHAIDTASTDRGLAAVTGKPQDEGRFRTPALRNVMLTAPYLHDGSAATVDQAIDRHRNVTGVQHLKAGDRDMLMAFLEALTDRELVADRRYALPDAECPMAP